MAMTKFANAKARITRGGKTGAEPASESETRFPWVKVYQNGASTSSMILIFNSVATQEFGLAAGDHILLGFDPDTKSIGIRKTRKQLAPRLIQHGSNANVLKVPFGAYLREYISPLVESREVDVSHGTRMDLVRGEDGWLTAALPRIEPRTTAKKSRKKKKAKAKRAPVAAEAVPTIS